jgi:predicted membrane protein
MGCSFMLILIVVPLLLDKKIKKHLSIVFASYMAFAIFAVIAPGNFLRRGYVDSPINPVKAAFLSCKKLLYGAESLFKDTGIVVIVLLFIVIGLFVGKLIDGKDLKKYVCTSLLMVLVPLATLFPIILGYGGYDYFPNRCTFLLNITLTLWILNLSLMAGILMNKYLDKEESIKIASVVIAVIACTCLIANGNRFEDNIAVKQIGNLANGRIKAFYTECNNMLREIETSPDEDVVLERNPYNVENFAEFYLSDDETFGYNVDIANFYGKKSVRVKYY